MLAQHLPREHQGLRQSAHAHVSQICHLIRQLATTQESGIGFVCDAPLGSPLPAHIQDTMGLATVLNAPKCDSGAHRPTRVWQNLVPKETLDEAYSNLPVPSSKINDMLVLAGLGSWQMPPETLRTSPTQTPQHYPDLGHDPAHSHRQHLPMRQRTDSSCMAGLSRHPPPMPGKS
jgi:hypothetical protein